MCSTIETFASAVDTIINNLEKKTGLVPEIRTKLIEALNKESFIRDCINLAFINFFSPLENSPEKKQTIYTSTAGYSIRIIYWPPGFQNTAHTHDFWTVTGVLHNALTFNTYKVKQDEVKISQLVIDKNIFAKQGEVDRKSVV